MNTIRCNVCKKMFSFDGLPPEMCNECKTRKEAQFQRVRELVKANPGITALEVFHETGVPLPTITKYIENGLLEVIGDKSEMGDADMQIWLSKTTQKAQQAKPIDPEAAKVKAAKADDGEEPAPETRTVEYTSKIRFKL